jgi:hypothetical protein
MSRIEEAIKLLKKVKEEMTLHVDRLPLQHAIELLESVKAEPEPMLRTKELRRIITGPKGDCNKDGMLTSFNGGVVLELCDEIDRLTDELKAKDEEQE